MDPRTLNLYGYAPGADARLEATTKGGTMLTYPRCIRVRVYWPGLAGTQRVLTLSRPAGQATYAAGPWTLRKRPH